MLLALCTACAANLEAPDEERSDRLSEPSEALSPVSIAGDSYAPRSAFNFESIQAARDAIARGEQVIDLDGDGRKEYRRTLDSQGSLLKEEIDADGNGHYELVWDFSQPVKTYREDKDGDGTFEEMVDVSEPSSNPAAATYVLHRDASGDGVIDTRHTYTIDPAAPTFEVLTETDAEQDGFWSGNSRTSVERIQKNGIAPVSTSGPGSCSASDKALIDTAVSSAITKGVACLNGISASLALKVARTLAGAQFPIACGNATWCAEVDVANEKRRWFRKDNLPIIIHPPAFGAACGSLESTVFHELLHYALGLHEYTNDPGDRVFACEKTCFGSATSQTCAACLGSKNGDTRCSKYPFQACTGPVPATCSCNGKLYPDEPSCKARCPSGLACFAFTTCDRRGPCR